MQREQKTLDVISNESCMYFHAHGIGQVTKMQSLTRTCLVLAWEQYITIWYCYIAFNSLVVLKQF